MEQEIQLNGHNKQEYPPMHTADFNPSLNDIIIYQTEDGEIKLDVKMEKDTVWLTQVQMGELFQTDRTSIVRHINNIYKSHELEIESTCAKIAQVRTEGKRNHSFSDGNKRIAAMLFLWFMEKNGILYRTNGEKRIADNTLVALILMIAESRTEEKDIMVKVVVNLINQNN